MSKLSRRSDVQVQEIGGLGQIARELTERDLARVAGGVNCTWFDIQQGGNITHVGYPPNH